MRKTLEQGQEIRVLTLWQPWASLVAIGAKKFETRPRNTTWRNYTGWIAIHAAQKSKPLPDVAPWWPSCACGTCAKPPTAHRFEKAFNDVGIDIALEPLPTSKVLALVYMAGWANTQLFRDDGDLDEIAFGDWSDGRICIQLLCVTKLSPIDYRGAQGLRHASTELRAAIFRQIEQMA